MTASPNDKDGGACKLRSFIRRACCSHEFDLADLHESGIPQPDKPSLNAAYYVWLDYYATLSAHPANAERVLWTCRKCGKEYRAHCGLDILQHGKIAARLQTQEGKE